MSHEIGTHTITGRKTYQHDRHIIYHNEEVSIYGVADGHGNDNTGHLVSEYACNNLISELMHSDVFRSSPKPTLNENYEDTKTKIVQSVDILDKKAIAMTDSQNLFAGSTLNFVIRTQQSNELLTVNVGDSRAILVSFTTSYELRVKQLSNDHTCTDAKENKRIVGAGGVVIGGLLNGHITMSRSLGNDDLKRFRNHTQFLYPGNAPYSSDLFINTPDITHHEVSHDEDAYIVLATDGIWKKLSNDYVAKLINKQLRSEDKSLHEIAADVCTKALKRGSTDNSTCLIVPLKELNEIRKMIQNSFSSPSSSQSIGNFNFPTSMPIFNSGSSTYNTNPSSSPIAEGKRFEKRSISNFMHISHRNDLDEEENIFGMETNPSTTNLKYESTVIRKISEISSPSSPDSVVSTQNEIRSKVMSASKLERGAPRKESWFRRKFLRHKKHSTFQS